MVHREQLEGLRDVLGEQTLMALVPIIGRDPDSFILRDCSLDDASDVAWQVLEQIDGGSLFIAGPSQEACEYVLKALAKQAPSRRHATSLRFYDGRTVYWASYGRAGRSSCGTNFDALVVVR